MKSLPHADPGDVPMLGMLVGHVENFIAEVKAATAIRERIRTDKNDLRDIRELLAAVTAMEAQAEHELAMLTSEKDPPRLSNDAMKAIERRVRFTDMSMDQYRNSPFDGRAEKVVMGRDWYSVIGPGDDWFQRPVVGSTLLADLKEAYARSYVEPLVEEMGRALLFGRGLGPEHSYAYECMKYFGTYAMEAWKERFGPSPKRGLGTAFKDEGRRVKRAKSDTFADHDEDDDGDEAYQPSLPDTAVVGPSSPDKLVHGGDDEEPPAEAVEALVHQQMNGDFAASQATNPGSPRDEGGEQNAENNDGGALV